MLKLIPTPIGHPQDITIRALREFEKTTLFLCEDTRETKKLLQILTDRFDFVYPKCEFISFNEHNGLKRLSEVGKRLDLENVVYVSDAGTPAISDPGQILVEYCQNNGIEYDVLTGANALTTAYVASGFRSGKFKFLGFLPSKGKVRISTLSKEMGDSVDLIIYESPHRILKLIGEIASIDPNRTIFCAKELTKKFQSYYRGTAQNILDKFKKSNIKGEWVVILEGKIDQQRSLSAEDILILEVSPKIKAKLLSKITDKTTKEWYKELI